MPAIVTGIASIVHGGMTPQLAATNTPASLVNQAQQDQAFGNAQMGLQQQQDFINALQGQGGLANQSQVFNQLGGIAAGGDTPALAQLAQASQANQAQQSALIAGQRNSGANVGANQRQAAMAGANIQQQLAGQSNALQAQQAVNALGMQSGIANQQAQNLGAANQAFSNNANAMFGNVLNATNQADAINVSQANAAGQLGFDAAQRDSKQTAAIIGGVGQGIAAVGSGTASTQPVKPQKMAAGGEVKPAVSQSRAAFDAQMAALQAARPPTMGDEAWNRMMADMQAKQALIDQRELLQQKANQSFDTATAAFQQQQQVIQGLQQQGGLANQSQVFNALGNVAQGQGFNPAQAQLANTAGANVAQQAANAGTQRNAGANSALLARQAAIPGINAQQQAANQAAAMQAQQTLGALGAQGNIAGQQVGNLTDASQAYLQGANQLYGNVLAGGNTQARNMIDRENAINKLSYDRNMAEHQKMGTFINAVGSLGAMGGMGGGGSAPAPAPTTGMGTSVGSMPSQYAQGGEVKGPRSGFGQHLHGITMKAGGAVPGKAAVAGDSPKNDTVPAMLSPGEVVIPRSVMQSQDPARGAAAFVAAVLAKNGKGLPRK